MEYLRRNIIFNIFMIMLFAVYGFNASRDTNSFLSYMALLGISFIVGNFVVSISIRDKEKLFLNKPQEKITYHLFYQKAVYPVLAIEIFIISIIVSGVLDYSATIKVLLQAVVFGLLYIFLNGLSFLIEQYTPSNYNYILYRASIRAASLSQNDVQSKYFLLGIKQYDKHLRRKFGLAINGLDNIFSRYVVLESKDRSKLFTSLLNTDKDSLQGARIINDSFDFNSNILSTVSNRQRIKDFSAVFIPIVAIIPPFIQMILSIK